MSYIDDYKTYVEPLEVPEIFSIWCSLSALAAAAQRKIWLNRGHFNVAPNLYIVLDAEAGFGKDVAMSIVRDDLLPEVPNVIVRQDSITKEAIARVMKDNITPVQLPSGKILTHTSLTVFATEMSVLIKKNDKDFVGFINGLYNTSGVFRYTTKNKGDDILINPYLNILACTTPDWVARNLAEDVIEGGFAARTFFILATEVSKRNPNPQITPEGYEARERLIKRLNQISILAGPVQLTPEAERMYANWYLGHYKTQPIHPKLKGYYDRKRIFTLKLAILFSIADSDELVVAPDHLAQALALLEMTEPALVNAMRGVGRNELNPMVESIYRQVKSVRVILLRDLFASNASEVTKQEFIEVLDVLKAQNRVEVVEESRDGRSETLVRLKVM